MAGGCVPLLSLTRVGLFHSCGNLSCLEKVVGNEWDTRAENACFSLPFQSYHGWDVNFHKDSSLKSLVQRTRKTKCFFFKKHTPCILALRGSKSLFAPSGEARIPFHISARTPWLWGMRHPPPLSTVIHWPCCPPHWKTGAPSFPLSSQPASLTILVTFVSAQRIHPTLWPLGYLSSSTQTTTSLLYFPLASGHRRDGHPLPKLHLRQHNSRLGTTCSTSPLTALHSLALGCKRPSCLMKFPAQVTSLIPVDDS